MVEKREIKERLRERERERERERKRNREIDLEATDGSMKQTSSRSLGEQRPSTVVKLEHFFIIKDDDHTILILPSSANFVEFVVHESHEFNILI